LICNARLKVAYVRKALSENCMWTVYATTAGKLKQCSELAKLYLMIHEYKSSHALLCILASSLLSVATFVKSKGLL